MSQPISTSVNRGLAFLGAASSLVGLLDIVAILIILNGPITTEQYGIATEALWLFPILDQVADLGLSAALIQRDDHTERRVSTVFWINLMLSTSLFGVLLLVAPWAAVRLYGPEHLVVGWMLVAYGGKLLLQNGYFIPWALMRRELRFKELATLRVIANTAEFGAKVGFAVAGFGIWCFVYGALLRTVVYLVGTQICRPYRPRLQFSLREAADYIRFGLRASGSQFLFYFYTNIDYPIVGYVFGPAALGLYKLAYEIVLEPVRIISNVVVDIAFPAFARLRHSRDRLVAQLISFTRLNIITVMAFATLLFVAAPELLAVAFPDYTGAQDAVRILCGVGVLRAVGFVAPPLLDGIGRPDLTLRYMTVAALTLPVLYVLSAVTLGDHIGFESVAVAWVIGYPVAFLVLMAMATRSIDWTLREYLRSVAGVIGCMILAGAVAAGVRFLMRGLPAPVILVATAAVLVLAAGVLLAYVQGLTLHTAWRSLREPPATDGESTP